MRNNNKRRSTLSLKAFIVELGEEFSDHMKDKLLELESRCYLTRKDASNRLDLKHVEHVQYEQQNSAKEDASKAKKEYAYGQFVVIDGSLYFSDKCYENNEVMQSPEVIDIYNSLRDVSGVQDGDSYLKKIDDSNVDQVVNSILRSCPEASQAYLDIVRGMVSRSNNK